MSDAAPATEVILIGGETLRVKGPVEAVANAITRGSQSDGAGWVILGLDDGGAVHARCAAVAYLRKAPPPEATQDHLRVA